MKMTERFQVRPGQKVDLRQYDPDFTAGLKSKTDARRRLKENIDRLAELQYLLYAENKHAVLLALQATDAGGKDGTIRHVMSGINPQGCRITSFKVPSAEEADHDFLWRIHKAVPGKGEIGIFNRSHYEDVLVVRVHDLVPRAVWSRRYAQINAFEKLLADNGVAILKFYLHISKAEQKARFEDRIREPRKHWKVNPKDLEERKLWDDYMAAYEAALSRCSPAHAPWFIIPANKKWFRNLAISEILVETLEGLDMKFPPPMCDVSKLVVK
ncbi:MAG: polyphosphate kinase 2 family protein [Candidatus Brocadiae bacterium]|nr:polyphosphate kinase 2 family protein [Candidatus Brocadiia bacterium]